MLTLAHQTDNPPAYIVARKSGIDVFPGVDPARHPDKIFSNLLRAEGRTYFSDNQTVAERLTALVSRYHPLIVIFDRTGAQHWLPAA